MNKKLSIFLKTSALIYILIAWTFAGCTGQELHQSFNIYSIKTRKDQPSILPDWQDGNYHDYYKTRDMLTEFNDEYPDLVSIFPIGQSVLNRDIWCIRITNENNNSKKYSCLYDGCFHGNEWEGGEACLYFAEYLLINHGKNATITNLLNKSEVYIVPIANPDGRQADRRHNYYGIDSNRNFDVHFGRIGGCSLRVGKWFPLPFIFIPFPPYVLLKVGRYPFSEPESRAMRDLMKELKYHDFSFYLTLHTATHCFGCPSDKVIRPEYEITPRELEVLGYAKIWVENNTEYEQAKDDNRYGAGWSFAYCFKECHVPSFCLEALNTDYEPGFTPGGRHDHLVHWMNTTLPVFMYLLVNIENLHDWEIPDISPSLPEGVPPPPLQ